MDWYFVLKMALFLVVVYLYHVYGAAWVLCIVLGFLWYGEKEDLAFMRILYKEQQEKISSLEERLER